MIRRWLPPLLLVVALLAAWEIYADSGAADSFVLPAPHAIAQAGFDNTGLLLSNLAVTAREVGFGIAVALLVGFVLAVAIHFSPTLRRAFYPLAVGSQAVPIPVVAPLLVFWWGFGAFPKLAVIVLICFFPIVVTTLGGLETVDPELLKLMRTFDASRWQQFRRVELPSALPGLLTGIKIAAVFSVIGAVFGEQDSGSGSGLGYLLNATFANYEPAEEFATVCVLSAFAILLFVLLTVAERRMLPWAYQMKEIQSR